jgi:hypothetical protein
LQVFPDLEVVGSYSNSDVKILDEMMVYLHFRNEITNEIPIDLYEIINTKLVKIPYKLNTVEVTRIALDEFKYTTKENTRHLILQRNAIKVMKDRIILLQDYLKGNVDYLMLSSIKNILVKYSMLHLNAQFDMESNDLSLIDLIASINSCADQLYLMIEKTRILYRK